MSQDSAASVVGVSPDSPPQQVEIARLTAQLDAVRDEAELNALMLQQALEEVQSQRQRLQRQEQLLQQQQQQLHRAEALIQAMLERLERGA